MTISNSNLLKPFITGTELPPFKEDVFSKTEEQFKKSPHGKLLFISGNENLVNISAEKIDEIKNSKDFFSNIVNIIIYSLSILRNSAHSSWLSCRVHRTH